MLCACLEDALRVRLQLSLTCTAGLLLHTDKGVQQVGPAACSVRGAGCLVAKRAGRGRGRARSFGVGLALASHALTVREARQG